MSSTTPTDTGTIIISLLEQGIPTGPIARAAKIDEQLVKDLQSQVRVRKYGSAEIAELLQSLMFDAYEEAHRQIKSGSPQTQSRMISLVLSRAMALVGRQSPEELDRLRNQLSEMLVSITNTPSAIPQLEPSTTWSPASDTTTST